MSLVRIVLHRPQNPANVGAAARVVANTGLQGLDLVDPCDYRTVEAWRMAWGAEDILEQTRVFVTLEEALADCVYVAALVGRRPRRVEPITARAMASEVSELASDARVALVFGCESKGLTEEELCLCQRRVRIPSHPRQPSLNLAQAVMVAAYEVLVARSGGAAPPPRAPHGDAHRALSKLKDAFLEIGFLPSQNPEARFVEWRELFGRAGLTPREVKLLLALGRRIANTGRAANRARSSNGP
ncbi:MAG TPA: TrmH family RNA methyltransferase [Vicinamibacteria bacterium]|nr:TrmH family RNA methyltransferase [Vicinamibacteria bacterium]